MASDTNMNDPKFLHKLILDAMRSGIREDEVAEYNSHLDNLMLRIGTTRYHQGFDDGYLDAYTLLAG